MELYFNRNYFIREIQSVWTIRTLTRNEIIINLVPSFLMISFLHLFLIQSCIRNTDSFLWTISWTKTTDATLNQEFLYPIMSSRVLFIALNIREKIQIQLRKENQTMDKNSGKITTKCWICILVLNSRNSKDNNREWTLHLLALKD